MDDVGALLLRWLLLFLNANHRADVVVTMVVVRQGPNYISVDSVLIMKVIDKILHLNAPIKVRIRGKGQYRNDPRLGKLLLWQVVTQIRSIAAVE